MKPQEVEKALAALESEVGKKRRLGPHLARHVLLALGEALRTNPEESVQPWIERARAAGGHLGEPWRRAVEDELSLACGEFVQSVDPRYLCLPNYDMDYTRGARARLADRVEAAQALGMQLSERDEDMLDLADRVLEAHERGEAQGDAGGAGRALPTDRG